jgi:hypothetical protein
MTSTRWIRQISENSDSRGCANVERTKYISFVSQIYNNSGIRGTWSTSGIRKSIDGGENRLRALALWSRLEKSIAFYEVILTIAHTPLTHQGSHIWYHLVYRSQINTNDNILHISQCVIKETMGCSKCLCCYDFHLPLAFLWMNCDSILCLLSPIFSPESGMQITRDLW